MRKIRVWRAWCLPLPHRWRARRELSSTLRFHKDNLRHLSRFPDFFVTKRILSTHLSFLFSFERERDGEMGKRIKKWSWESPLGWNLLERLSNSLLIRILFPSSPVCGRGEENYQRPHMTVDPSTSSKEKGKVLRVLPSGRWVPRNQGWLNFWETKLVTVRKSLHRSCWTELTCQGILLP